MSFNSKNDLRISPEEIESLMSECIQLAESAASQGEVPVGAVVWRNGSIISRAHNRIEQLKDATAHAEILAIKDASAKIGNWRLDDCLLCVTLEPCSMCAGAIVQSRIPVVVFGVKDAKFGALGSTYDLSTIFPVRVIEGIQREKNLELLKNFFGGLRKAPQ